MTLGIRIVVAIISTWQIFLPLPAGAVEAAQKYSEEGATACLDCHETEYVMGIANTVHAKVEDPKSPATTRECQSCHGPSATHMQFPIQVANVHFGKNCEHAPEVQNQQCLECHGDRALKGWRASAHGYEKVVCGRCHSMHDPEKVVPARAQIKATCTSSGCHDTMMKKADAAEFTHALGKNLREKGELTCSGCHNPHGPLESERCIECHGQTPDVLAKESEKAKRFHEVAAAKETSCIRCHKGIAHPIRPLVLEESRVEMEKLIAE